MTPFIIGLVGFILTVLLTALLRHYALKLGLTDNPGGRKSHKQPTPVVGGMAMGISLLICYSLIPVSFAEYRGLIFGSVLLLIVGVIDDIFDISARLRLLTQFMAALAIILYGGDLITHVGSIFASGSIKLVPWLSYVITIFAVVGYINAMNMLDGVDGLAGMLTTIQVVFMIVLVSLSRYSADLYFLIPLLAILLGFLCFNSPLPRRRQALVFMGDAGSMLLGFVVVWFSIQSSQLNPIIAKPVVFLWIAALPIFEIGYAVLRRIVKRVSPFKPDRSHLHHILHDRGWGAFRVVAFESILALFFAAIGILGQLKAVSEFSLFWGFVAVFIIYSILMTVFVNRSKVVEAAIL